MSTEINYTIEISDLAKSQLNKGQINFIEMAYARINHIENNLDMDITPAPIRLFYIKEFYTIFNELLKLNIKRKYKDKDPDTVKAIDNLIETVDFIRNLLLHFPLFTTWDEIKISKDFNELMGGTKSGRIYKYLNPEKPRENLAFNLKMSEGRPDRTFTIKYPDNVLPDQDIYIKDILTEKEGALSIISIMAYIF